MPQSNWRIEAGLGLVVFAAAGLAGIHAIFTTGFTHFYQRNTLEALMWACGHGMVNPAGLPEAATRFLDGQSRSLSCAVLDDVARQPGGPGNLFYSQLYLSWAVAGLWRLFGISYDALAPLFFALHGLYALAGFVLARLFFPRWAALAVGLLLATSPLALSAFYTIRDYSKAPFILWALVFIVLALRARSRRSLFAWAALAGLATGLGSGFRVDVMIVAPLALAVFVLGVRGCHPLSARFLAGGVYTALFLAFVAPVVSGSGASGGFGWIWLQGFTTPYSEHLKIGEAPYDLGWRYDDNLTMYSIGADIAAGRENADMPGALPPSETVSGSSRYTLTTLPPLFFADIATRALKSAAWMSGYFGLLAPPHQYADPANLGYPAEGAVARVTKNIYDPLRSKWLPYLGIAGLIAFLARVYLRSPREAFWLAIVLGVLLAYSSIQFSRRHNFHLEVVTWLSLASLVALPFMAAELRARARPLLLWFGGLALLGGLVYGMLLFAQDRRLVAEIERELSGPRHAPPTETRPLDDGRVLLAIAGTDRNRRAIAGDAPPGMMPIDTSRLVIELGGPDCAADTVDLHTLYADAPEAGDVLERDMSLQLPGQGVLKLFLSAFYTPHHAFSGLVLDEGAVGCVLSVERLEERSALPAIFTAVLAPDWRTSGLYQRFGGF